MSAFDDVFMAMAVEKAREFEGQTAPNPPVGAVIVHGQQVIAVAAHESAGSPHAEINALLAVKEKFDSKILNEATLYVTLEPCNHQGKTSPCTETILNSGLKRVVFGCHDPNLEVKGGGAGYLQEKGLDITTSETLNELCLPLLEGFRSRVLKGRPYLLHKQAFRESENKMLSMIPMEGEKTFTSEKSLKLAHEERRRSDGILTGLGTVLADLPLFTVRLVPDFKRKKRILVVVGTQKNQGDQERFQDWRQRQEELGFEVHLASHLNEALQLFQSNPVLRVLIECGPKLSQEIEKQGLWDERLVVIHQKDSSEIIARIHNMSGKFR